MDTPIVSNANITLRHKSEKPTVVKQLASYIATLKATKQIVHHHVLTNESDTVFDYCFLLKLKMVHETFSYNKVWRQVDKSSYNDFNCVCLANVIAC